MAEILLGKEYIFYIARPTQASLGYPAPLKGREFGEHPIKRCSILKIAIFHNLEPI